MGGGSSDAATCLIALNRLWDINKKRNELLNLAVTLGADVPFLSSVKLPLPKVSERC